MFTLFCNLYWAMLIGRWDNLSLNTFLSNAINGLNAIGTFLTSIFNNVDTPMTNLGDVLMPNSDPSIYFTLISFVLATITSIGIVVMAVKGVKRIFGVFFYGVR